MPKMAMILIVTGTPRLSPKKPVIKLPIGNKLIPNCCSPPTLPLNGFGVCVIRILECIFIKNVVPAPKIIKIMQPIKNEVLYEKIIDPIHRNIVAMKKINPGLVILTSIGNRKIDPIKAPNPWHEIMNENSFGLASNINFAKYGPIDSNVKAVKFPKPTINRVPKIIGFFLAKSIPALKPEYVSFLYFNMLRLGIFLRNNNPRILIKLKDM